MLYIKYFKTINQYNKYISDVSNFIPHIAVIKSIRKKLYYNRHYNRHISISDVVITCNSTTYNGEAQYANIVVKYKNTTLANLTDYTISGNDGKINAGSYTITINGINKFEGTKTCTFTINKVTPTVVIPTAKTLTYNGSAQELVNAGSTDYGTIKYSLDNSTWSTSIPIAINYGSYTVYYKVEGNSNINDVTTSSIACSINEKQVTATIELSQDTYTYDNTAKQPTVTVKDGNTVINSSEYTVTYSNNINAGTATVTITDNVGGNYNVIGSTTFTINKAVGSVTTVPTAKTLTYNGASQELINAGIGTGTMMYKLENDAPHIEVEYLQSDGQQYIDTSITPNAETGIYIKVNPLMYNHDNQHDMYIVGLRNNTSNTRWCLGKSGTTNNFGNAYWGYGVYEYFTTWQDNGFYYGNTYECTLNFLNSKTATFKNYKNNKNVSVNLRNLDFTPSYPIRIFGSGGVDSTYTKAAVKLYACKISQGNNIIMDLIPVKKNNVGCLYDKINDTYYYNDGTGSFTCGPEITESEVTWSSNIPGTTNAGNYVVSYKTAESNNYTESSVGTVNCSISKANISPTVSMSGWTYGETASNPSVSGNSGNGTVTYTYKVSTAADSTYTSTKPTDVGTYTVRAQIAATTNYNAATVTNTFTINDNNWNVLGENQVLCKYNTTSTSSTTKLLDNSSSFASMSIDGVEQSEVVSSYTFDITGEHTVLFTLAEGVTSIGTRAFYNCSKLISITIGNSITSIGNSAFIGCSGLTTITIPDSVTSIGNSAFERSGLTTVTIPDSVTLIDIAVFQYCSGLTNITIPDSVTSIGNAAFNGCSRLTSVTIPNSVTSIGSSAFNTCSSLTTITIPDSVISIGNSAFSGCSGLTSISVAANNQTYDSRNNCNAIIETSTNKLIVGCKNTIIPNSVTSIGNSAFYYCSGLTNITIPDSVTSIGNYAFNTCSSLTSIIIPDSVTSIGSYVFSNCFVLTSITCNALTAPSIQNNTFQYIKFGGTLTVPTGSTGYDVWMGTGNYYLGKYNWTKVEQ